MAIWDITTLRYEVNYRWKWRDGTFRYRFLVGSVWLIFWTLLIITTLKYVLIALRADNNGEGGIFALYTLVRQRARWLVLPAMIGGAALLADGMLTPAVTVTTAIEGLKGVHLTATF